MMKNDPFEDFVKDHRDEFDDLVPSEDLFEHIETRKRRTIPLHSKVWISRVAAALVVFTIGFGASELISTIKDRSDSNQEYTLSTEEFDPMEASYQEFYEMQIYYTQQIDGVRKEIVLLSHDNKEINNEIDLELDELKAIFEELKNDLEDHVNNQEVIEAMIMNYRIKLRMLQEMKNQLDPINNDTEEEDYETVDI